MHEEREVQKSGYNCAAWKAKWGFPNAKYLSIFPALVSKGEFRL
jgi:hypothetical protein